MSQNVRPCRQDLEAEHGFKGRKGHCWHRLERWYQDYFTLLTQASQGLGQPDATDHICMGVILPG